MKKQILIGVMVLSAMVFSSCTAEEQPSENNNTQTQQQTEQTNGQAAPTLTADDSQAIFKAVGEKDIALCGEVSAERRSECEQRVEDNIKTTQAIEAQDPEMCRSISSQEGQASCMASVNQTIEEDSERQSESDAGSLDIDNMASIIENEAYEQCSQLQLETSTHVCELSILVKKAIEESDASWCDRASTSATVSACRQDFEAEQGIL